VGDAEILDGALVCDGEGDYVYSENLDFGFSGHSLEVMVSLDSLEGTGAAVSLDGKYSNAGYTHEKHDSVVYNEDKRWYLGSEDFARTMMEGSDTAETASEQMIHLVASFDADGDEKSVKLYRNGVLESTDEPGDFLTAAANEGYRLLFCKSFQNGDDEFMGKIYMGAVYDYALSAEDVDAVFRSRVIELDFNGALLTIASMGDTMHPGDELLAGQGLVSANKQYVATFRSGKFYIYDMNNEEIVFESTNDREGTSCTYNVDGSMSIQGFRTLWHSRTTNDDAYKLVMGSDGMLRGYDSAGNVYYTVGTDEEADSDTDAGAVLGAVEDVSSKWTLTLHGSTETFLLYFCALLVLVNVVCGSVYCYSKRTAMPYKVVSMDGTEAEVTESELEEDNEKFLE